MHAQRRSVLAEWLTANRDVEGVVTGIVELYGQLFEAVRCRARRTAYRNGRRRGHVWCDVIEVLGELPGKYHRKTEVCFVLAGDDREWYVARLTTAEPTAMAPDVYPFGAMFQLAPWDVPGKIDDGETEPYKRRSLRWTPDQEASK